MKRIILLFMLLTLAVFGNISEIHQKALSRYQEGKISEAINLLEGNGVKEKNTFKDISDKSTARILNDYAYFLIKNEEYEEGYNYLLLAKKYDENRASIYYNLLEIREEIKDMSSKERREYVKKYLDLTKKESYLAFDKFDNFLYDNVPKEMLYSVEDRYIKEVFIENRLLPDTYIKKGWKEFNEGNLLKAEMLFIRAVELDENYAASYEGLVTVYMNTGQETEAKEYARRYFLAAGKKEDVSLDDNGEIVLSDKIPEIVKKNLTREKQIEVLSTLEYIPNLYLEIGEKYIGEGKVEEGKVYLKKYLEYMDNRNFKYSGKWSYEKRFILPESIEKYLNRIEILDIIYAKAGRNLKEELKYDYFFIKNNNYYVSYENNGKYYEDPLESFLTRESVGLGKEKDYMAKYAINLKRIAYKGNNLSILKCMPYLEEIDISNTGMDNIEFIREMPFKETLKRFTSRKNKILDYSPLEEFYNLEHINIYMHKSEYSDDLSYLLSNFSLEWIDFSNENFKVNDLSFLGNKPRLKSFSAIRYFSLKGLEKIKGYNLYFEIIPLSKEELYKYKDVFASGIFSGLGMYDTSFSILASSDFRKFLLDIPTWKIYHTNNDGEIESIEEIKDYDKEILLKIFSGEEE